MGKANLRALFMRRAARTSQSYLWLLCREQTNFLNQHVNYLQALKILKVILGFLSWTLNLCQKQKKINCLTFTLTIVLPHGEPKRFDGDG
jgi:hypothetical protein